MAEILSQQEIDSLLSAVMSGEVKTAAAEMQGSGKAKPFDFTNLAGAKDKAKGVLDAIHQEFTRRIASLLSTQFNLDFETSQEPGERASHGELDRRVAPESIIATLRFEGIDAGILVVFRPLLGGVIIDRIMGGAGVPLKPPRPFTELERSLLHDTFREAIETLSYAWTAMPAAKLVFDRFYAGMQWMPRTPSKVRMFVKGIRFKVAGVEDVCSVCYPSHVLEWIEERLNAEGKDEKEQEPEVPPADMQQMVESIPVHLAVRLGSVRVNVHDVLNMRVGDVLLLDKQMGDAADVVVGGKLRFKCAVGARNERLAVTICRKMR